MRQVQLTRNNVLGVMYELNEFPYAKRSPVKLSGQWKSNILIHISSLPISDDTL